MNNTTKVVASLSLAMAGAIVTLVGASPASAVTTVAWSDTSITNGESTTLDYTMGGTSAFVAQWYGGVFVNCFWRNSSNSSYPITYESARTTTSKATSWTVALYATDCTSGEPALADAVSSSTLTLTPAGPYGPDAVSASDTTETGLTLNWATDSYATGYSVYQDGVLIATLGASDVSYAVTGLTPGTSYDFLVVGFNDDFGGHGTTVTLTTKATPELALTGIDQTTGALVGFAGVYALLIGGALTLLRRKV